MNKRQQGIDDLRKYLKNNSISFNMNCEDEVTTFAVNNVLGGRSVNIVSVLENYATEESGFVYSSVYIFPCTVLRVNDFDLFEAINAINNDSDCFKCYIDDENRLTVESSFSTTPKNVLNGLINRYSELIDALDEDFSNLFQVLKDNAEFNED